VNRWTPRAARAAGALAIYDTPGDLAAALDEIDLA
jgi:hypothetical protein